MKCLRRRPEFNFQYVYTNMYTRLYCVDRWTPQAIACGASLDIKYGSIGLLKIEDRRIKGVKWHRWWEWGGTFLLFLYVLYIFVEVKFLRLGVSRTTANYAGQSMIRYHRVLAKITTPLFFPISIQLLITVSF